MAQDYNATINLPKTDFPMRAGLPKREPEMLQSFENKDVYNRMIKKNQGKPLFILHDGPPYANGNIHIGHALNKTLKDMIVRHRNMTGYCAPYVPGWDTHGLPIESAILKDKKVKRHELTTAQFRDKCKEFALGFVEKQTQQFKRLGVVGDWAHPYLTLHSEYEAQQIRVFGAMAKKGYIYKGLKPVYWCPHDETALAEAEIEYADDPVTTIFVKFRITDDKGKLAGICDLSSTYFVIWTTTTWTIPGNMGICLNPDFSYAVIKASNGETYIMADELAESVLKKAGLSIEEKLAVMPGTAFEYMTAQHPLLDQQSLLILGDHVTLDAGTGCVHTAPAYGADDFNICKKYIEIDTSPTMTVNVDDRGRFTEAAGPYKGISVFQAHEPIFNDLVNKGAILCSEHIVHSYPHCWRCKKPIIFRTTEQWFCSVDAIKDAAIAACDQISWNPEWGKERMVAMIAERSDWCISRQRVWGVPIPVFYCGKCGKDIVTSETIDRIADLFAKNGSNIWFEKEADELVPQGFVCPFCGHDHFTKETDIMDVWFDSGSSQTGVLKTRPELQFPADVYLEGGDQYRGWFQSSMLTSIAATGKAPYKQIITHGWTVDGEGKAMHKSLGNAVAPEEIIKDYGADMLRLWVSSTDYRQDVRISKEIMKQLSQAYLKIRNTARYMLGNLDGFDPNHLVSFSEMESLDRWAVARLNDLVKKVEEAYCTYEFHSVYRSVYNFCVIDLSNFYLDIVKDRLYCEGKESKLRRSAQSAMYVILDGMTRMLAPVLAFTSEEIWAAMPHDKSSDPESVLFNPMYAYDSSLTLPQEDTAKWDLLIALRDDVNKALELARSEKKIGKSLEANLTLYAADPALLDAMKGVDMAALCIVSKVDVVSGAGNGFSGESCEGLTIAVAPATASKCPRCWMHHESIGTPGGHPELCPRCAAVMTSLI